MTETIKTKWATGHEYYRSWGTFYFTVSSKRKLLFDTGLKVAGTAAGFAAGWVVGDVLGIIPVVNQAIPAIVQEVAKINVHDNLTGLFGVFGGVSGLLRSGIKLDKELEIKRASIGPLDLDYKQVGKPKMRVAGV